MCNAGFTGKLCNYPVCSGAECAMFEDLCMKTACENGGTCVNVPKDNTVRCVCPRGYSGDICQLHDTTHSMLRDAEAQQDESRTRGSVVMVLVGNADVVRHRANDILHTMNSSLGVDLSFRLDQHGRKMIYAWDSFDGRGRQLNVDDADEKFWPDSAAEKGIV